MARIAVITGAASGIGKATRELLESRGERVIGVDLRGTDISADITTVEGRKFMVDEAKALARAAVLAEQPETLGGLIYSSSKRAVALWVRRNAAKPEWAGAGIPLNAAAPGVIATPMTTQYTSTEEARKAILEIVPMPLNGIADANVVARLLAWLGSEENTHLCGQVIFIDGGSDAVIRGESTW